MKPLIILFFVLTTFLFMSCDPNAEKRDQATAELLDLTNSTNSTLSAIRMIESSVDSLMQVYESAKNTRLQDSTDHNTYLSEHKMAVAAIVLGVGGTVVAADLKEQFTEAQKNIGGWVAGGALVYSLFNADEISQVVTRQEEYNARIKEETLQVNSIVQEINNKQSEKSDLESKRSQLENESALKREELKSYN